MNRPSFKPSPQSGQTLIWVAIALVVLVGAVALAVDFGSVYGERRSLQNAADAAALEAARSRCFDEPQPSASIAAANGAAFATTNYPRPYAASLSYSVAPRTGNDWEFEATAVERVRMYFAGVLGVAPIEVKATAAAACGGTDRACGVFPLAFDQSIWSGIKDHCGETFYVWTGDKDSQNQPDPTPIPPNCDTCDCTVVFDKQGNLQGGVLAVPDVGRAWLDFTSAGTDLNPVDCGGNNECGAAELKCWIRSDSQVVLLRNSCVSGTSGVKWGTKGTIDDRAKSPNPYANVPLFDTRCAPTSSPSGHSCDSQGFNIVGFGCVRVMQVEAQQKALAWKVTPTPESGGGNGTWCTVAEPNAPGCQMCLEEKMIPVQVGCDPATGISYCDTACGKATGGGDPGAGVKAVSLIK